METLLRCIGWSFSFETKLTVITDTTFDWYNKGSLKYIEPVTIEDYDWKIAYGGN